MHDNIIKHILSLALAAILMLSLVPGVWAESESGEEETGAGSVPSVSYEKRILSGVGMDRETYCIYLDVPTQYIKTTWESADYFAENSQSNNVIVLQDGMDWLTCDQADSLFDGTMSRLSHFVCVDLDLCWNTYLHSGETAKNAQEAAEVVFNWGFSSDNAVEHAQKTVDVRRAGAGTVTLSILAELEKAVLILDNVPGLESEDEIRELVKNLEVAPRLFSSGSVNSAIEYILSEIFISCSKAQPEKNLEDLTLISEERVKDIYQPGKDMEAKEAEREAAAEAAAAGYSVVAESSTELRCLNPETGFEAVLMDDYELLTQEEREILLTDYMMPLTEFGNIAFWSTDCSSYSSTLNGNTTRATDHMEIARLKRRDLFEFQDATIFMINMSSRKLDIQSYGKNYKVLTKSRANTITNNVRNYATQGNYFKASREAMNQMRTVFRGQQIPQPMKHMGNLCIALMLGLLTALIIVLVEYDRLHAKTVRKDLMVVAAGAMAFNFAGKKVTRTEMTLRSSSSGGSSCSSCSSGSSCGGCGGGGSSSF